MEKIEKNIIVCPNCGIEQEYNPDFPYCRRCGLFLPESLLHEKPKNTGSNEALKGGAILLFLLFVLIFIFVSRFYATIGMIFTVILYIVSFFVGRREDIKEREERSDN